MHNKTATFVNALLNFIIQVLSQIKNAITRPTIEGLRFGIARQT